MAKMARKAAPRKVMVDPSSASASIRAAKTVVKNAGGDYDTSRAVDSYAKELKKVGIIINPKEMYGYKPKSSLKSKTQGAKPKAPRGR